MSATTLAWYNMHDLSGTKNVITRMQLCSPESHGRVLLRPNLGIFLARHQPSICTLYSRTGMLKLTLATLAPCRNMWLVVGVLGGFLIDNPTHAVTDGTRRTQACPIPLIVVWLMHDLSNIVLVMDRASSDAIEPLVSVRSRCCVTLIVTRGLPLTVLTLGYTATVTRFEITRCLDAQCDPCFSLWSQENSQFLQLDIRHHRPGQMSSVRCLPSGSCTQ